MSKEQIQVVLIETFRGEKYVLRLDKEYEKALAGLFKSLVKNAPLGSLAHISLRNIKEESYNKITASAAFMTQEGIKDRKDRNGKEKEIH